MLRIIISYRSSQFKSPRTISPQKCSINMIDIENFTHIFTLLDETDKLIITNYIQCYSVKAIAKKFHLSQTFVYERIYQFQLKLEKNTHIKIQ